MSERAKKIEEAARALLQQAGVGRETYRGRGLEILHEVDNKWLSALACALALPVEPRSHRCIDDGGDGFECPVCPPAPATGACERCGGRAICEADDGTVVWVCPDCKGTGRGE